MRCVACLQGTFDYGGQTYDLIPSLEGASRAACERLVTLVLKQNEPCGAEQVSLPPETLTSHRICKL